MLKEIHQKNAMAEKSRRWFQDPDMGLFVWNNQRGNISRFQLIYIAYGSENTLEWSSDTGIRNYDSETYRYESAVLSIEAGFDLDSVRTSFESLSEDIDPVVRKFVLETLSNKPCPPHQQSKTISITELDWGFLIFLLFILIAGYAVLSLL